jgi:hypothetical protein
LFGDADDAVPVEKARAFATHLSGIENEIVIYPGEAHGFFGKPSQGSTAPADGWGRLLDFIGARSRRGRPAWAPTFPPSPTRHQLAGPFRRHRVHLDVT